MMYIVKNLNYCIRNGVFETNSSSIHSFVLRKQENVGHTCLKAGSLPYIPVELDEYDHKFDILRTDYNKMSYLLTYVKSAEILFKCAREGNPYEYPREVPLNLFASTEGYQLLNDVIRERFDRFILPVNTAKAYIGTNSVQTDTLKEAFEYFGGYTAEEVIFNPKIEIWVGNFDPDETFLVPKGKLNHKWKYIKDSKGFERIAPRSWVEE